MKRPTKSTKATKATKTNARTPLKAPKSAAMHDLITTTRDTAKAVRRARLAELVTLIKTKVKTAVDSFYDVGLALREVLENKLYLAERHASFEAFLQAHKLMSRVQASKLIAIVTGVGRAQALSLGVETSYALVSYTRATPEADTPASLVAAGKTFAGKPIGRATKRDILAAAREVRGERAPTPAVKERDRNREKVQRWLVRALRDAKLGGASITRTRSGLRAEWSLGDLERVAPNSAT